MLLAQDVAADEAAAAQKKASQGQGGGPLDMLNKLAAMYKAGQGQKKQPGQPNADGSLADPGVPIDTTQFSNNNCRALLR